MLLMLNKLYTTDAVYRLQTVLNCVEACNKPTNVYGTHFNALNTALIVIKLAQFVEHHIVSILVCVCACVCVLFVCACVVCVIVFVCGFVFCVCVFGVCVCVCLHVCVWCVCACRCVCV